MSLLGNETSHHLVSVSLPPRDFGQSLCYQAPGTVILLYNSYSYSYWKKIIGNKLGLGVPMLGPQSSIC